MLGNTTRDLTCTPHSSFAACSATGDAPRLPPPALPSGLGKIFWIPDRPVVTDTLTVTATPADDQGVQPLSFTGFRLAKGESGPLYPSSIPLPRKGIWRLEASAGDNKGCFLLSI